MLDRGFLFEFSICHPSDWHYNAVNQRYWIQYHGQNDILCPDLSLETHPIRPSETSVDYALRHKLLPFRKWLNITHSDTFIHGPFEFASVRGQKTCDFISQDDWNVLLWHVWCFRIQSHALTFLHIRYTWIVERMWLIMIRLTATIFVSKLLHIRLKVLAINVTLDKRSWEILKHPPLFYFYFLFYFYKEISLRPSGSGGEVWPY